MGFLISVIKTLLKVVLAIGIFIGAIFITPGLPPDLKFEAYQLAPAKLLTRNSILDKAEPLKLDKPIFGPESIASRGDELFTGLLYGDIIKIKGDKVTTVAKTGKECQGHYWDTKCGRPLGMRFNHQGQLIVADGSLGILSVNVDTGSIVTLTSIDEVINGTKVTFPDDLDIDKAGNIYWSDASTKGNLHTALLEAFGEPSGRLMVYDAKKKKSEVLVNGIHFANGIQLSKNEDFVMVTEFMRARVLRYFLKGPRAGQHEVFVDGLPGLPDNVRSNGRGGYYVCLFMPRYPYVKPEENMVDVLCHRPALRKLIMRVQHFILSLINMVEVFIGPDVLIEQFRFKVNNLGSTPDNMDVPKKTVIVEFDESGKILGILENGNREAMGISEVHVGPIFTYFGSPVTKNIWRIKTKDLTTK